MADGLGQDAKALALLPVAAKESGARVREVTFTVLVVGIREKAPWDTVITVTAVAVATRHQS